MTKFFFPKIDKNLIEPDSTKDNIWIVNSECNNIGFSFGIPRRHLHTGKPKIDIFKCGTNYGTQIMTFWYLDDVSLLTATDNGSNKSIDARTICWRIVFNNFLAVTPTLV